MNESSILCCPTCQTVIDPDERCTAERGYNRCMEKQGHFGWHWSETGAEKGILRWTGLHSTYSCFGHLSLSDWCQKERGHEGAHNNGRGTTFSDPEDELLDGEME